MNNWRVLWCVVLTSLGAFIPGCATNEDFGRCNQLEVQATPGPQPQIRWTAADCGVYQLTVEQGGQIRWAVTMNQLRNGIQPPVTYGISPSGAQGSQAVPLTVGPYKVLLMRLDDQNRLELAGEANFNVQ